MAVTEEPLRLADQRSAPYTSASAPTGRTQGIDIDGLTIYCHWIFLFVCGFPPISPDTAVILLCVALSSVCFVIRTGAMRNLHLSCKDHVRPYRL